MRKEYMAPEFEELELISPVLMDTTTIPGEGGPDFVSDPTNVEEEDPFA